MSDGHSWVGTQDELVFATHTIVTFAPGEHADFKMPLMLVQDEHAQGIVSPVTGSECMLLSNGSLDDLSALIAGGLTVGALRPSLGSMTCPASRKEVDGNLLQIFYLPTALTPAISSEVLADTRLPIPDLSPPLRLPASVGPQKIRREHVAHGPLSKVAFSQRRLEDAAVAGMCRVRLRMQLEHSEIYADGDNGVEMPCQ